MVGVAKSQAWVPVPVLASALLSVLVLLVLPTLLVQ